MADYAGGVVCCAYAVHMLDQIHAQMPIDHTAVFAVMLTKQLYLYLSKIDCLIRCLPIQV